MTTLLDSNVLVALAVEDHVHHESAQRWLEADEGRFASCPITQGSLLRVLIRSGTAARDAQHLLTAITADQRHEFWPDSLGYEQVPLRVVLGHRQVTDAYLAQLARSREAVLATLDGGLASMHPDVVELVPHN